MITISLILGSLIMLILMMLFSLQIVKHWIFVLIPFPIIWSLAEGAAILIRQRMVKKWLGYELGYEKDTLREIIVGVVQAEVSRNDVTRAYEEFDELILKTKSWKTIRIPVEIEEYDDLRVRLLNWNKTKKTYHQVPPDIEVTIGPKFAGMSFTLPKSKGRKSEEDEEIYGVFWKKIIRFIQGKR